MCDSVTDILCAAETVNKYSRKAAIVQTGLKTQVVSLTCPVPCSCPETSFPVKSSTNAAQIMGVVSLCIIATCVTLLVINRIGEDIHTE